MPLDLGIKIPQDDSVRVLMRIAERIEWSELSGAYERKNRRGDATAKQMFLLVVLAFMNGIYSTRKIEKACRTDNLPITCTLDIHKLCRLGTHEYNKTVFLALILRIGRKTCKKHCKYV